MSKKRHFYVTYATEKALANVCLMTIDGGRYVNIERFVKDITAGYGGATSRPTKVMITNILELSAKDFKDFSETRSNIEPIYQ